MTEELIEPSQPGHASSELGSRALAAWEIASITASFLIAEWLVLPFAGNSKFVAAVPIGLALGLVVLSHRARRESPKEIGWRTDNFVAAAKLLLTPVIVGVILIFGVGLLMESVRFSWRQIGEWALWLPVWGLLQQYVVQGFINRRAQLIYGRGLKSIVLVAVVFAILHLPNPWLTAVTFVGGLISASVYQRVPNLLAPALAHAILSMTLAISLPPSVIHSLRVGIKYFG